eukprot:scaffold421344_cov55-Attheya_sp.AAC.1
MNPLPADMSVGDEPVRSGQLDYNDEVHLSGSEENLYLIEGWLRKRGSKLSSHKIWKERYFTLNAAGNLSYFTNKNKEKPKGTYQLTNDCSVSPVYIAVRRERTKHKNVIQQRDNTNHDRLDEGYIPNEYDLSDTEKKKKSKGFKSARETLYCVKISWNLTEKGSTEDALSTSSALMGENVSAPPSPPEMIDYRSSPSTKDANPNELGRHSETEDLAHLHAPDLDTRSLRPKLKLPARITKRATSNSSIDARLNVKTIELSIPTVSPNQNTLKPLSPAKRPSRPSHRRIQSNSLRQQLSPPHKNEEDGTGEGRSHSVPRQRPTNNLVPSRHAPSTPKHWQEHEQFFSSDSAFLTSRSVPPQTTADQAVIGLSNTFSDDAQVDGISKHYCQQVKHRTDEERKYQEQLVRSLYISSKRAAHEKKKKHIAQGTKVVVAAGTAVTVGLLTAGIGLIVGAALLGATVAAGGTGAAATFRVYPQKGEGPTVELAAVSLEEANMWKAAIEAWITANQDSNTWMQKFTQDCQHSKTTIPGGERQIDEQIVDLSLRDGKNIGFYVEPNMRWAPVDGGWTTFLGACSLGLRIFREEKETDAMRTRLVRQISAEERPYRPLKAQVTLNASPLKAFMCLMSNARIDAPADSFEHPFAPNSEQCASFRIIENVDDHTDIIHLVFRPLYLFPTWTAPRDFVLYRYWRYESDGTYDVCYDSVEHPQCPPLTTHVRGVMYGTYTISPRKKVRGGLLDMHPEDVNECLLSHVVQVDPRGWVPRFFPSFATQGYGEAFSIAALMQLLDIRDALEYDRFVPVSVDYQPRLRKAARREFQLRATNSEKDFTNFSAVYDNPDVIGYQMDGINSVDSIEDVDNLGDYDFKYASIEEALPTRIEGEPNIENIPPPFIETQWARPDANSFRVRGKMYKKDKIKINAGPSAFRLLTTDVLVADKHIRGVCNRPKERVQLALGREKKRKAQGLESDMHDMPPFVFVVNILVAGPPHYQLVFYYAVDDISMIDGTDGTPFSKLAKQFFFSGDDNFRDRTFKLIPQIVKGNFVVRKAVGSTPAIIGTKLKQTYVTSDRFLELIIDTASSSVAAGVTRLSSSYGKELVLDMAFLLEGNDESTLPEKVMGCVRLKNADLAFSRRVDFVD